jgi:hypothetical protein
MYYNTEKTYDKWTLNIGSMLAMDQSMTRTNDNESFSSLYILLFYHLILLLITKPSSAETRASYEEATEGSTDTFFYDGIQCVRFYICLNNYSFLFWDDKIQN